MAEEDPHSSSPDRFAKTRTLHPATRPPRPVHVSGPLRPSLCHDKPFKKILTFRGNPRRICRAGWGLPVSSQVKVTEKTHHGSRTGGPRLPTVFRHLWVETDQNKRRERERSNSNTARGFFRGAGCGAGGGDGDGRVDNVHLTSRRDGGRCVYLGPRGTEQTRCLSCT